MIDFFITLSVADKIALITGLATLIALIIALIQLGSSIRVHKQNSYRESVVRAVDLAKIFQQSIVINISFIIQSFSFVGLDELISRNVFADAKYEFTSREALKLFNKETIDEYFRLKKKFSDPNIIERILESDTMFAAYIKERNVTDLRNEVERVLIETINTLEWMAMLINTNAASSTVIFQSLHQLTLQFTRLLYFELSFRNKSEMDCDKFYTNLIQLYTDWNKKRIYLMAKQRKTQKKYDKKYEKFRKAVENSHGTHIEKAKRVK